VVLHLAAAGGGGHRPGGSGLAAAAGAEWHGFGEVADDYVLLDPLKVTLVMPGLNAGGVLAEHGIPAAVVSKFLWERGLVVEKTGLYSSWCCSRWGSPRASGAPCLPSCWSSSAITMAIRRCCNACRVVGEQPARYQGLGLRELCQQLHDCYRANATASS
jgi:arginine decarboxylase